MEQKRDLVGNIIATIIVAPVIVLGAAYLLLNLVLISQLLSQDLREPLFAIPIRFE